MCFVILLRDEFPVDWPGENRVQIGIALPRIVLGSVKFLVLEVLEAREELKAQEVAKRKADLT